jgi:membrane-anchored mycosin MYCP
MTTMAGMRRRLLSVLAVASLLTVGATAPQARAANPAPTSSTPGSSTTTSPTPTSTDQNCAAPPVTTDPSVPWPQVQLAPQQVWPLTTGAGVTVAVVDSGVDGHSPQLAGRVLRGLDVINPGDGPANTDCYGHGTFVAGIIAAAPTAGTGFAGVAPGATILPIRAANNAQDGTADLLATGIRDAVDDGASVINLSASTTTPDQHLAAAVRYAQAHNVLIVAAAANDAQDGDPVPYPAALPGVLGVGAVDSSGARADFSQTGPYVSLVAPGVNVISVGPGGGGQWQGSGTSYAAPFVAGVAALVRAYRPHLSAAQVLHRLLATADHPATTLPDPGLGWGTVDPLAAVTDVLPEEGPGGAIRTSGPVAARPDPAVSNRLAGELTVLGLLCLAAVTCLTWLCGGLLRRGTARWSRRVVRVVDQERGD